MRSSHHTQGSGPGHPAQYGTGLSYNAYGADYGYSHRSAAQTAAGQPLRRRGGPVPAPSSLLSARSSHTSLLSTPMQNPYESSTSSTSTSTSPSASSATATTTPPREQHRSSGSRQQVSATPHSVASTSAATPSATQTSVTSSTATRSRSSRHGAAHRNAATVPMPLNGTAAAEGRHGGSQTTMGSGAAAAPRALSRRAQGRSSRSPTPERDQRGAGQPHVPSTRGPGSAVPPRVAGLESSRGVAGGAGAGPTIVRASTPAAASVHSVRSGGRPAGSGNRSSSSSSARPPPARQATGVPSSGAPPAPAPPSSERVVTAGPVMLSSAEREKAEREARKQLRAAMHRGNLKVHGYVAQTAYAQKNPFRRQDFAEFAANPQYQAPEGFEVYAQAMATRVYGREVSRASQGEFMMQRLVDAANPATAAERAEMEALLSTTLDRLQVGDWFYKWTRINHVHQRYVWLNLQRGTLMWSLSPKQSVVLNEEIKLSTVTSITPDCLQLEAPMRVFYRMTINTPDRCISLATEIRKKFDVWYRVLLQLTAPNLVYGVPGVWGRPSSSVNTTGRGAASRWASRFSPLDAVVSDTARHMGTDEFHAQGMLSSSD